MAQFIVTSLILQKLQEEAQEELNAPERHAFLSELSLHQEEVQNLRALLRSAIIRCAAKQEKQTKKEREALFSGSKAAKELKNP